MNVFVGESDATREKEAAGIAVYRTGEIDRLEEHRRFTLSASERRQVNSRKEEKGLNKVFPAVVA